MLCGRKHRHIGTDFRDQCDGGHNVSGKAGDSYMGNVWGCGYPTERKDGRVFGLEVTFVGADGSLTGYAGGLDTKARLLAGEGVPIAENPPRIRSDM